MASLDIIFKFADGFSSSLNIISQKLDSINRKLDNSSKKIQDFNSYLKDTESNVNKIGDAFDDLYESLNNFTGLQNKLDFSNGINNKQKSSKKNDSKLQPKGSFSEGRSKKTSNKPSSKTSETNSFKGLLTEFVKQFYIGTLNKGFEEGYAKPGVEKISAGIKDFKESKGLTKITKDITNLIDAIEKKTPSVIKKVGKYIKKDTTVAEFINAGKYIKENPKVVKFTKLASKVGKNIMKDTTSKVGKFTKNASDLGNHIKETKFIKAASKVGSNIMEDTKVVSKVGRFANGASKILGHSIIGSIPGLVISGVNIATAPKAKRGRVIAKEAGGWAGGLAGAAVGAKVGAGLGALGLNPATVAAGSLVGGLVGGAIGTIGGDKIAAYVYDNKKKMANWYNKTKKNVVNIGHGAINGAANVFGGAVRVVDAAREVGGEKIANWYNKTKKNVVNIGLAAVKGVANSVGAVGNKKDTTAIYNNLTKIGIMLNKSITDLCNLIKKLLLITNVPKVNKSTQPISKNNHSNNLVSNEKNTLHKVNMKNEDVGRLRNKTKSNEKTKVVKLNPKISITFGDVHETADVNKIVKRLKVIMRDEIATACEGAY